MKYRMSGSKGEERGGSKARFFSMNRKVKQANKYVEIWGIIVNIEGDQGTAQTKIFRPCELECNLKELSNITSSVNP